MGGRLGSTFPAIINGLGESGGTNLVLPYTRRVGNPRVPVPSSSPWTWGVPSSQEGEGWGANAASLISEPCYWPEMISPPPSLRPPDWRVQGCCAPPPARQSFRRATGVYV